jgi:mRNA-decapping enzyme subunit 2
LSANPYAPSPPPFQSPPQHPNFQPVQPKPRSAHQDNLLNLFRSQSVAATTPPPAQGAEPAELSAFPHTPGHVKAQKATHEPGPPPPNLSIKPNLLEAFGHPSRKPEITSATVSGPVNVPDFDTVKKHVHMGDHSRGPSPAQRKSVEPQQFNPSQILKRQGSAASKVSPTEVSNAGRTASPISTSNRPAPQTTTFKPQILKRPSPAPAPGQAPGLLNDLGNQMSPPQQAPPGPARLPQGPTTVQQAFDRRETALPGQKNALLSLFQKSSQPSASPVQASTSPLPPHGLPQPPVGLPSLPSKSPMPRSPVPPARSPPPPTPKSITSGVISPVSPLPEKGSAQNSPAHLASRSRISSIGETMPPNIVIPKELIPTSDPATAIQRNGNSSLIGGLEEEYSSTGSGSLGDNLAALDKGKAKATSPVDKTFLLGFLENVARGGR